MEALIEIPEGQSNKTDVPDNNVGDMNYISRSEAIKAIQKYGVGCLDADDFSPEQCERFVIAKLNELPSVTLEEPTTKNDLGVDAVSRKDVHDMLENLPVTVENKWFNWLQKACMRLAELPSVTPQEPRWIPVSEKLPEPFTFVNATCRSLIDDREDWVIETLYSPIPKEFNEYGFSDWGNIPMLNCCEAEVIAWVERIIPQPYKAESENT